MEKCPICDGSGFVLRSKDKSLYAKYDVDLAIAENNLDKIKICTLCSGVGSVSDARLAAYRLAGIDAASALPVIG